MRDLTFHLRRPASVGRQQAHGSLTGATDMARFFPLVATLVVLCTAQSAGAAEGKALYEATCVACHGPTARGAIAGVPDLAKGGRLSKPDAEVAANIVNGFQSKGSPMAMPPKGGNPNLTAADVQALVIYLRALTGVPASAVPAAAATGPAPPATSAPAPSTARVPAAAIAPAAASAAATSSAPTPAAAPMTVPVPVPESAASPGMTAFARGAKAWASNCSRCHAMRDPKDLTDRESKVVSTHMRLRAGLDGDQVRDITVFLQGSN